MSVTSSVYCKNCERDKSLSEAGLYVTWTAMDLFSDGAEHVHIFTYYVVYYRCCIFVTDQQKSWRLHANVENDRWSVV
jgi:hypothetical protein